MADDRIAADSRVIEPIAILTRVIVGGAFVVLGWKKFGDPVALLKAIQGYDLIPSEHYLVLNTIAVTLPTLEIVLGVCLVLGIARRGAAFAAFVMLAFFSVAIFRKGSALAAEQATSLCAIAFDCGCGTGVEKVCSKLGQNAALLLGSLFVACRPFQRFALRDRLFRATGA